MSRRSEFNANSTNKRGIVVDRDPTKSRVKVKFDDEDESVSQWVDVLASSSGSVKSFGMPGMGDEVWCAMDAKGEAGAIIGSRYNDSETPPSDSNDQRTLTGPFGTIIIDGSDLTLDITGNITLKAGGNILIEAGGQIETKSAKLTHNGKNVGHDHKHLEVMKGVQKTGVPE